MSHRFYTLKMLLLMVVSTFANRLRMRIHGISAIGHSSKFFGKTYFYKKKNSTIKIGNNCVFRSHNHSNLIGINRKCSLSTLTAEAIIEIGDNCGFSGTVIGCFVSIVIGKNVKCGANTLITDSDWHSEDSRSGSPRPVIIGENVWIGEGARILKGVTIGDNSIIGAGSIVTGDIPANVIAAGNPCKIIKSVN